MDKSLFTPEQEILQVLLREVRQEAGLRQVDLAKRLHKPQSFVSRYESGERILDLPELRCVCHALGVPLQEFIRRYEQCLEQFQLAQPIN